MIYGAIALVHAMDYDMDWQTCRRLGSIADGHLPDGKGDTSHPGDPGT